MISLHLPEDLARAIGLGPHSRHEVAGSLGELLARVDQERPGLLKRITEADGRLRPHLNLFVGARIIRGPEVFSTELHDEDEVWLLRAVSGG